MWVCKKNRIHLYSKKWDDLILQHNKSLKGRFYKDLAHIGEGWSFPIESLPLLQSFFQDISTEPSIENNQNRENDNTIENNDNTIEDNEMNEDRDNTIENNEMNEDRENTIENRKDNENTIEDRESENREDMSETMSVRTRTKRTYRIDVSPEVILFFKKYI